MSFHDKVTRFDEEGEVHEIALWGSHVRGIVQGSDWVRVGRFYLPCVVDGIPVLSPLQWQPGAVGAPQTHRDMKAPASQADSAKCQQLQAALAKQTAEAEHEHKLRCELEHKLAVSKQKRRRLEEMVTSLHSKLTELETHCQGAAPGSMPLSELHSGPGFDDAAEVEEAWPAGAAERPLHRMRKADLVHDLALETETSRAVLERCSIERLRILARDMRSKRQKVLLARQLFSATYEGTRQQTEGTQRSRLSAAPYVNVNHDSHAASTTLAVFRVTESHRYEKPGTRGFNAYKAGSEFLLDMEAADAEIRSKVQDLTPGVIVRLVLQHDAVVKDTQRTEEHVVTYLRASETKARRLLAKQSFSASFESTRLHTSEGGHPTTLASFRVQESQSYENAGGVSFVALLPGQEFRLCVNTASADVREKVQGLHGGELVHLTYQQEYVDNPITHSGHVEQAVTAFKIVGGSHAVGSTGTSAFVEPASHGGSMASAQHSSGGSTASRRPAPLGKSSAQDTRPIELLKKAELVNALAQEGDMPRAALEKCSVQRLRMLLRESRAAPAKEHHDEEKPATLREDIKNEGVLRGGLHWIKDHTPGHHHAQGADTLGAPGPAWTRGELERPADTHDMGRWTRAVYSEEQQQRLAVDETGQPRGEASVPQMAPRSTTADEFGWTAQRSPSIVGTESLPGAPAGAPIEFNIGSPRGEFNQQPVEEPEGLRDLGYRSERFYTTEQQDRLGVDDIGRPLSPRSTIPGVYAVNAEGLGNSSPVASGTLRAWMQEQEWRTRHVYSQGPT